MAAFSAHKRRNRKGGAGRDERGRCWQCKIGGGGRRYKTSNWALNNSPGWVKSVKTSCGLLGITTWLSISQVHDSEPVLASILLGKFMFSSKMNTCTNTRSMENYKSTLAISGIPIHSGIKSPPSWQLQCHFLLPTPRNL